MYAGLSLAYRGEAAMFHQIVAAHELVHAVGCEVPVAGYDAGFVAFGTTDQQQS